MKIRWLSFFIALCIMLGGCSKSNDGGYLISDIDSSNNYLSTLKFYLPNRDIKKSDKAIYQEVEDGNVAVCFDIQAKPAMEQGVGRYWYPHILSTIVLAIDRDQTDIDITGWNDLWDAQVKISTNSNSIIRNMMLIGSISYGLNRKDPSKRDALELLEYLYQDGRFRQNDCDAAILICLDHEAVNFNRNGGDYEIVVPSEGTLSFRMGLLSDEPLTLKQGIDDALLSLGLSLVNGKRPLGFPDDYESAYALKEYDLGWFFDITKDISRDLRRQVYHQRLYSTADLREHILSAIVTITVILLWKGTVSHRMIQQNLRRVVDVIVWLMVGWLLLRLFKYQLSENEILSRACWYGYYPFQLGLPLALYYLTVILDQKEDKKLPIKIMLLPFISYITSVSLVFTNDLHQLVFKFNPNGNWSDDYSYGPVYWMIIAISIIFLISAIMKMFYKGRKGSYWGGKIFPLLFCIALFAYITAYACRVPLAWETDLTVFMCIASMLFFEVVLHTGLIPVNIQYQKLFKAAPIGLILLDKDGHAVLASGDASYVSNSIWKRLLTDMDHPLLKDKDTLLHAVPIHGGMAVWQEDLSALNRIRQDIQDVQLRLKAVNSLLKEEEEVKKRLLIAETNQTLFEHLDRDMESRINALSDLIESIKDEEYSEDMVAYVTLCLCHTKRRCNLFFLAYQGEPLLKDELGIYLDELTELAHYAGLKMLIRCDQNGVLEIKKAALCYDFAFESICQALKDEASPLMGYLMNDGNDLMFRFLPVKSPEEWQYSEELLVTVSMLGGQIFYKDLDDAIGICLIVPLGGEPCV